SLERARAFQRRRSERAEQEVETPRRWWEREAAFDESKISRHPPGSPDGGRFAPKDGAGSGGGEGRDADEGGEGAASALRGPEMPKGRGNGPENRPEGAGRK